MAENISSTEMKKVRIKAWRKRYRFPIQSAALVVALLAPFGLYWGLEAGQNIIAAIFFSLLALALAVTTWIG
jgi:hypothetical protein